MEAVFRDGVSGKEATHEVSETATAAELLEEACTLFGREVLGSALEVDGAVVCAGVVGGVSGGEVSVGSLGVHSDSKLVLCRTRDRVLAVVAEWVYQFGIGLDSSSLPEWAWDDEVVAFAAVAAVAGTFKYVSERLKANHSFMLDAVKRNRYTFKYASIELRSDKKFVLAAVSISGFSLEYVCDCLKADREVVITAITNAGRSLQYAAESLRADKQVVLTAVANDSGALQYASDSLKADREVVMAAVANGDSDSLGFASAELQAELRRGAPCL